MNPNASPAATPRGIPTPSPIFAVVLSPPEEGVVEAIAREELVGVVEGPATVGAGTLVADEVEVVLLDDVETLSDVMLK